MSARGAGERMNLEDELRRTLADPPVPLPEVAEPLRDLDRRVGRARRSRRAGAVLSLTVLLAAGASGATELARHPSDGGRQGIGFSAPGEAGGAGADARRPAVPAAVPPPEVVAAARTALAGVVSGNPSGPVRWVAMGSAEYLVQVQLDRLAMCKFCRDPAAGNKPVRGTVIEVRVYARATDSTAGGAAAPGRAPQASPGPSPGPVLAEVAVESWTLLRNPTDLSRFGTVHTFTYQPR